MNRLAALALVLCPVMGLGPAPKGWQAPASAKIGAAMVCKTPAPSTAAGYKGAIDGLDDASWGGADQSTSVMLPDGRIVWIYADTARTVVGFDDPAYATGVLAGTVQP